MMRINLLPPEILERRKAEARVGWVAFAAIVVGVVLAFAWGLGYMQLQGKEDKLASIQQQTQTTNAQADQLAVFEERATELESRRQTANLALADRRPWSTLYDELSLVLPADIWIQTMSATESDGLQISGIAVDAPSDSPDVGHKTIAKALVRLADLGLLTDVWLVNSTKGDFADQPVIQFQVTAQVSPSEGGTQ